MAKKPLNEAEQESIIKRGISAIFSAVANKKMARLQTAMMKDPKFRESVEKLAQLRDDMDKTFKERYRDKMPRAQAEFDNWWQDLMGKK